MSEEKGTSCTEPSAGPMVAGEQESHSEKPEKQEVLEVLAKVGQKAPDFEATAFIDNGFKNIKLSDYHGKWITLCFYPGDFTFV